MVSQVLKVIANWRSSIIRRRLRPGHHHQSLIGCGFATWSDGGVPSTASGGGSFHFHTSSNNQQRFTNPVRAWATATAAVEEQDSSDVDRANEAAQIERITAECMARFLPRFRETTYDIDDDDEYIIKRSASVEDDSLALELGERTDSWNDPWKFQQEHEEQLTEEEYIGEESLVEDQHEEVHTPRKQSPKHRSNAELLANFDPQNPPTSDNLEDLELWLECEAQQEAVARFQKAIDSARTREDFSCLSAVQRQVLHWFQPLSESIANRQKEFILQQGNTSVAGTKHVGPYLCALPPSKMAVIVGHAAVIHALVKGDRNGMEGVPLVSMAKRLGEVIEEEVVIHRLLYKRLKDAQVAARSVNVESSGFQEGGGVEEEKVDDQAQEDKVTNDEDAERVPVGVLDSYNWAYNASHLKNYFHEISKYKPAKKRQIVRSAIRRARNVLGSEVEWTIAQKIQLGVALFQILLENATIENGDKGEMAFTYEKRWTREKKLQSFVVLNDRLQKLFVSDKLQSFAATTTRHKPMIIPPKPWTKPSDGGYMWLKVDLMRYHGCNTQREALQNGDLSTIYDGLNALGRVPWKINEKLLQVAQKCWESNIDVGDIPSRTDFDLPLKPVESDRSFVKFEQDSPEYKQYVEENRKYRDALARYNRIRQKNMDLRSLRYSAMLKLDQAEKFKNFEKIYFPYNMDFRGRAYPCPPHLSNVGSDLCRGLLKFAESKPLGPRGLYWLKVHLANFAGKDKMSFDERAAFVEENMERIRDTVRDPFEGQRWWLSLEDPFQGLATCYEIVQAIDSGDPESYMCSLPVHMDGSCNGLQHYAALGRDLFGGKAVNLCAMDEPQDVYIGVMHEVSRRVTAEAARTLDFDASDIDSLSKVQKKELTNNRAAKLVNGLIDRGVVKRTVMTSVYGVTYIGARQQIHEKIESKLEAQGYVIDDISHEIFQASGYLARLTMEVMGELFTGAKDTMKWLTTCARLITQQGYPIAWISPIGLPAIQPYRQKRFSTLVTILQNVTIVDDSDDLPIHKQRQVSAFPPNYIHSLDSSHMLLTALEMDRRGLMFSAVHDSFWTHPCDIDEMNSALRDTFVDLYDQPLLERLKETWEARYPDLEFPDLPMRGKLDLNEVKDSKYFFQ